MSTKAMIDTSELTKLAEQLSSAAGNTSKQVHTAVARFAVLLQSKSIEKVQKGTRSGASYRRGGKSGRRSAPGEPAKTDTGILASSIRPVFGPGYFQAEVGSLDNIAEHGGFLEDGTSRMAARPWLEPTLKENAGNLADLMTAAIKKGGLAS